MNMKILSVGEGDLTVKYDPKDKSDRARASKLVQDLLRLGYAIMVEVGRNEKGPMLQRVTGFDEATCEYFVMGLPEAFETQPFVPSKEPPAPLPKAKPPQKAAPRREPISRPAYAVARTAGGYDPVIPSRLRRGLS